MQRTKSSSIRLACGTALATILLVPQSGDAGWAIRVSAAHDFATEEDGRGDIHLDRLALQTASGGMEVQWEDELDICNPVGVAGNPGFLQAVTDAYSNLQASDIDLFLDSSGSSPWAETTADLWGDPAVMWGVSGPTMRVVILDDPPMMSDFSGVFDTDTLGASAALWVWNGSAWGFAKNLMPGEVAEYAILPLSASTYSKIRGGSPDLDWCPSAETISHEIGHALGFSEARHRNDPAMSVVESPTALPTLWQGVSAFERDPGRTMRFGAYTQSLLRSQYSAPLSDEDDWVMQHAILRADPTQPDNRAVPRSVFQVPEINPQHLISNSGGTSYLDCVTRKTPVYFAQYSEVSTASSGCTPTSKLEYILERTVVLGSHVQTNNCSWLSMWEYQHDEPLVVTDADLLAAGVTPPTVSGLPVQVDLTMRIHPLNAPFEWDPDDNETTMQVTLYPAGSDATRCAPQKQVASTPVTASGYGKAIAATQTTIKANMWTATGAPHRPVGGQLKVGEVRVQKWDALGNAVLSIDLASPFAAGNERFGSSVAIHGRWLVVGAPGTVAGDGRAYLYRRTGDVWALHTSLTPVGASGASGRFGTAVAVRQRSLNGVETSVLFVGEPEWGTGGRVAVYTINETDPPVRIGGIVSTEFGADLGASLAVSNDTLLIGVPRGDGAAVDSGVVKFYDVDPAGTTPLTVAVPVASVSPSDGATGDEYGAAVSVDADVAVVGAPGHKDSWFVGADPLNGAGAAYVYGRAIDTPGPWTQEAKLHLGPAVGGREAGDRFGASVATFRANILVGAPKRDLHPAGGPTKVDAGAAFLYSPRKTEDFSIRRGFAGLGGSDRDANNHFGAAVAFGDRLLLVGAPQADTDAAGVPLADDIGGVRVNPYRTFDWVR